MGGKRDNPGKISFWKTKFFNIHIEEEEVQCPSDCREIDNLGNNRRII